MRTALLVLLVACEHGQTPPGGLGDGPSGSVETAAFFPVLCTTEDPCPINHVTLDDLGLPGAQAQLVVQPLFTSIQIALSFSATSTGLHVERPQIIVGGTLVFDLQTTVDVRPGETSVPLDSSAMTRVDTADTWVLRFVELSPL